LPSLARGHKGEFIVIEVESGDYEVDRSPSTAEDALDARHPGALTYLRKIGPEP
jgi:hypothetical protein